MKTLLTKYWFNEKKCKNEKMRNKKEYNRKQSEAGGRWKQKEKENETYGQERDNIKNINYP